MEKLVLRGIMYGADKIPDKWFEKVPGGFYKGQQDNKQAKRPEKDDRRRGKRERSRRRRHSDEYEERRPRYEDPYDNDRPAHGSGRRRRDAERSSYDGGDDYDSVDGERQRRRSRRSTISDTDRYGYNDGFSRRDSTRRSYAPVGRPYESSSRESQESSQYPDSYADHRAKRNSAAAVAAGAGTAAAIAQQSQQRTSTAPSTAFPAQAPVSASYIPYSNIYGLNDTQLPANSISSVQPNSVHQIAPVVSPASSYGSPPANTSYDSRRVSDSYHAPHDRQQDSYQSSRSHSPSFDSAGSRPRRVRSERRPDHEKERFHGKLLLRPSTLTRG